MAYGAAKKYGGTIQVMSEVGLGSVFTILLPTTQDPEHTHTAPETEFAGGDERILFVDDEHAITQIGRRLLEKLGYTVTTRTSSVQALDLFRAAPEDFDLVITDMTMPVMLGDRLASELRKIRPDIPVILCTGYSKRISAESMEGAGGQGFLQKPVVKAALATEVRRVLDEAT